MVSVPSFGDSFFIDNRISGYNNTGVSVPSFGDSFFISNWSKKTTISLLPRFRPLIRGFFFYPYQGGTKVVTLEKVSVPSFGDSFFITEKNRFNGVVGKPCFRPLIRGFFFYKKNGNA